MYNATALGGRYGASGSRFRVASIAGVYTRAMGGWGLLWCILSSLATKRHNMKESLWLEVYAPPR